MTKQQCALSLKDVEFFWSGGSSAFHLTIKSFEMKQGESVILIGPSGSGKSTLLGLICGTLLPHSGVVEILGQNLTELSGAGRDKFRGQNIGIIFQQLNLVPYLSVIENVLLPIRFSFVRRLAIGGTEQHCHIAAKKMLAALQIPVEKFGAQKAGTLSVGQQQRVAAARAFIGSPPLIIADEPTSSLDAARQIAFLDLLFEQQKQTGASLLMVSHDLRIAERFDRIVHLSDIAPLSLVEEVS